MEQQRDCVDLVGFDVFRFLTEDQTLARGPCADHVQRLASLGFGVGAAGGFAVDCDDIRIAITQAADPGDEAFGEQLRALIKSFSASWLGMPPL